MSAPKPGQHGEPWKVNGGIRVSGECGAHGHKGCLVASVIYFSEHPEGDHTAKEQRIVACVNALDGRDPAALAGLIEAAKLVQAADDYQNSPTKTSLTEQNIRWAQSLYMLRAALAAFGVTQ